MKYSSRFWLFAPLALFLALAAWAMIHWWILATAFDRKLTAVNGHEAIPGITLSYAGKTISGFPFNIDVTFTGLTVSGRGAHGPFRWTTEKFALHRLTYGRAEDIYEAAGNQSLDWTDAAGRPHAVKLLPGSLRASAITDARGLARFDLDIIGAVGTAGDGRRFTVGRAQLHLRRHPKSDMLDLMVSADAVKDADLPLFGGDIHSLRLYTAFSHGAAFAPLLAGKTTWPEAAADWRQQGGGVTVGPVTIASTGLNLSTTGTFADTGGDLRGLLAPLY